MPHPLETVPRPSKTTNMPHPSEVEASTTVEVTLQTTIEAPTPQRVTEVPAIDDMKVTPPVETKVTTSDSTESSVHIYVGFLGGPNDCSMLTGYVDHVAFRLWPGEVCI